MGNLSLVYLVMITVQRVFRCVSNQFGARKELSIGWLMVFGRFAWFVILRILMGLWRACHHRKDIVHYGPCRACHHRKNIQHCDSWTAHCRKNLHFGACRASLHRKNVRCGAYMDLTIGRNKSARCGACWTCHHGKNIVHCARDDCHVVCLACEKWIHFCSIICKRKEER